MKTPLTVILLFFALSLSAAAQTFDVSFNAEQIKRYRVREPELYHSAFRLWLPDAPPRYLLVMLPPYHGDRDSRRLTDSEDWREFATAHRLALLGCRVEIKQGGDPMFPHMDNWFGRSLMDAIKQFAADSQRPELDALPLMIWGNTNEGSAGEAACNLAIWQSRRVAAFVALKVSGVTLHRPTPELWQIPGLIGVTEDKGGGRERSLEFYETGRWRGAAWTLAIDPAGQYDGQRSEKLGRAFLTAVMAGIDAVASGAPEAPWVGDLGKGHAIYPADGATPRLRTTVWLPNEDFARIWQLFVGGKE